MAGKKRGASAVHGLRNMDKIRVSPNLARPAESAGYVMDNRKEASTVIRSFQLAAGVATLVAGTILPVLAQTPYGADYRGTIEQQRACRPNVFQFCSGEIPNVRRITACLRANYARLSPDCAAIFAEEQQTRRRR
jgi:hypothetical protein